MRWILAFVILAGAACAQDPLEPLPLEITLRVEPVTGAVGDSLRFELNAQGGSLIGLSLDYGDGATQSLPAAGARTAKATYRHAYARSGVYDVTATVVDALQGEQSATARIQIR